MRELLARSWWMLALQGAVALLFGILAILWPGLTALVLVLVMGANALITGALQIATAVRLRKAVNNEWLMVLAGVVSVLFGLFVFAFPGAGALALVWLIALWAIVHGVLLLSLAFRVRGWRRPPVGDLATHH